MSKLFYKIDRKSVSLLINKVEPFFGYLLSAIDIRIDSYNDIPYAAATNNTIFYNRSYIDTVEADSSKLKEFITVTLHEIYHIYSNHCYRFGFHSKGLYKKYADKAYYLKPIINMVLDAIINHSLKESGYNFKDIEVVYLSTLLEPNHPRINSNDWTEEELLAYVLNNSKFNAGDDKDNNGGDGGDNFDSITLPSGATIKFVDVDIDVLEGDGNGEDQEQILKDLAKKAAEAIKNNPQKQQGTLSNKLIPSNLSKIESADLRWEDRLKQIASNCLSSKIVINHNVIKEEEFYGYVTGITPFNKCSIEYPYIRLPEPDTVVVFIDLSGSIYGSIECLNHFLHQVNSISKSVGNLLLVTFDVGITGTHLFNMSELQEPLIDILLQDKDKYIIGGGGTDVIPLFKHFLDESFKEIDVNNVCLLVVLTDLYLESVPENLQPVNLKGDIQVVWSVLENQYNISHTFSFGELLIIK